MLNLFRKNRDRSVGAKTKSLLDTSIEVEAADSVVIMILLDKKIYYFNDKRHFFMPDGNGNLAFSGKIFRVRSKNIFTGEVCEVFYGKITDDPKHLLRSISHESLDMTAYQIFNDLKMRLPEIIDPPLFTRTYYPYDLFKHEDSYLLVNDDGNDGFFVERPVVERGDKSFVSALWRKALGGTPALT